MPAKKQPQTPLHYSRKKGHVEIDGDPADVKTLVWFDLFTSRIALLAAPLLFLLSKLGVLAPVWKFIRAALSHLIVIIVFDSLLNLSG